MYLFCLDIFSAGASVYELCKGEPLKTPGSSSSGVSSSAQKSRRTGQMSVPATDQHSSSSFSGTLERGRDGSFNSSLDSLNSSFEEQNFDTRSNGCATKNSANSGADDAPASAGASEWHDIRNGVLDEKILNMFSLGFVDVLRRMLDPDPKARPSAIDIARIASANLAQYRSKK